MPNTLTPAQFVKKWSQIQLKEKAASQTHFNDICTLVSHKTPLVADPKGDYFTFEADAEKPEGQYGWADAWYKNKFIWEYKGPHQNLDAAYQQLLLYKDSLGNPPLLITSDMQVIFIHTNFTNTVKKIYPITLDDIQDGRGVDLLRRAFYDPDSFRPAETPEQITKASADQFVKVANQLQQFSEIKLDPERLAHFIVRLLFCLFAEDIRILPEKVFAKLLHKNLPPNQFRAELHNLFATMRTGGFFWGEKIPHFNGSLFDDDFVPESLPDIVPSLRDASQYDWGSIDPSIFGTLFERIIDESKRAQLGAHYTSKDDILMVIEPVLMQPLRNKWQEVCMMAETAARNQKSDNAFALLKSFSDELASLRVLDPACGSGNFLYLALRELLDLQKEIITLAARLGLPDLELTVDPHQLYGIELNLYAHELAQITVWIGYLQWRVENGFAHMDEPILRPLKQIENKDAIINITDCTEPDWPAVDVVIGNPPFIGGKLLRTELGDTYVEKLYRLYEGRVQHEADLVCYWFEKARAMVEMKHLKQAGLLATQGIRSGANRKVLERIKQTGDIFWAYSDRNWILDGATVHVSMIGFDDGTRIDRALNGNKVSFINSNLTALSDLTSAKTLPENLDLCFMGVTPLGPFVISESQAREWIEKNKINRRVLRPFMNAVDITRRPTSTWIIDFGTDMDEKSAAKYKEPFLYITQNVKPFRVSARAGDRTGVVWWRHQRPRPEMRAALYQCKRYIATPGVSKYRLFVWLDQDVLADHANFIFAREDDYFFGLLQSTIHELWARGTGSQLREAESGFRYTPTTTFETFPLPWAPGKEPKEDPRFQAIAAAAKQLDDFRTEWLNPSSSLYSGSLSKIILQKRTMTNLYNALKLYREQFKGKQRNIETWRYSPSGPIASLEDVEMLDHIHVTLDHAVLDAYGWPYDLSDEHILERLLTLNLERAEFTPTTKHSKK
jgi:type II restriction/modification system DNA methylase subunit YeeA